MVCSRVKGGGKGPSVGGEPRVRVTRGPGREKAGIEPARLDGGTGVNHKPARTTKKTGRKSPKEPGCRGELGRM